MWASAVNVSVNADTQAVVLDYDLNWFGKKATRMAESLWMTFSPATAIERTNWQSTLTGDHPLNSFWTWAVSS